MTGAYTSKGGDVVPPETFPERPGHWWRDPLVAMGAVILTALLISAGVEQYTAGRLATPDWLVTLTQTGMAAATTSGLIGQAISSRRRDDDEPTAPVDPTDREAQR